MDWDRFLLDRANTDLKMYKNFDNIVKDDKHITIKIKDGKLHLPKVKKTSNIDIFINRYEFIENILNYIYYVIIYFCYLLYSIYNLYILFFFYFWNVLY